MHRGRNRSRKPVELASTTTSTTATTTVINPSPSINRNLSTTSPFASSYSLSPLSSPTEPEFHVYQNPSHSSILNPFLYPHSSSSGPPGSGFSPQNSTTHNLFLDSGSSSHAENDYRYFHGMREGVDERAFFPEASGSARSLQDSYQQLAMSSYKGYSHLQFDSSADTSKQQQEDQQQHCFVLGTDFKSSATRPIKLEKEGETQKPLHHFFVEISIMDLHIEAKRVLHGGGSICVALEVEIVARSTGSNPMRCDTTLFGLTKSPDSNLQIVR
ncbi:hypothetical protein GH714_036355 [Hevea brasiliensis]|uniref:Uncharacterized protein n=1 Tax=Hevea brasiliensis TaxID=3981 RepID=A0A6A6NEP6_HEVBR|nr:hypothetical protein GH714_036355 [Hevea brasiliensis]